MDSVEKDLKKRNSDAGAIGESHAQIMEESSVSDLG